MTENDTKKVILPASIVMGITGAIVGGTVAAARGIKDVRAKKATRDDVVNTVLKESAGSGLSAAVGTAAVGSFKLTNPILGGLSFAAVTIGTKYLWDHATATSENSQQEPVAETDDVSEKEEA